jgi:peroxiredoxin
MLTDARPSFVLVRRRRLLVASSYFVCLWVGCQREPADAPGDARGRPGARRGAGNLVAASGLPDGQQRTRLTDSASPSDDAAPTGWGTSAAALGPTMPQVLLSDGHASTCRVKVGDTFPNLTLTSLDGSPVPLESQAGQRLTVVVFWSVGQPMSVEQLRRLQKEFAGPYQDSGVRVIAINVGNSAEDARSILANIAGDFVSLHDPNGEAFHEVATTILPRTYLLRADRKIVWFDMEYSRSTSRELHSAIRYALNELERQAEQRSTQAVTASRSSAR